MVGVVVRDGRLLVIRRSKLVRAPLWHCFPGGAMEAGESEEQALAREMQEELGVAARPVRRLYQSVTPWRVDLRWWLAELDHAAQLTPHPAEVESVQWLSVSEMLSLDMLLDSNRDFLAAWKRGAFAIDGLSSE